MPDAALVEAIRQVRTDSPCHGADPRDPDRVGGGEGWGRGLSQGLAAAASCGPAHLEGARAPPDVRARPIGDNPHGPPARSPQSRRHDHPRDHRHHVGNRHDRRLHRRAPPGRRLHHVDHGSAEGVGIRATRSSAAFHPRSGRVRRQRRAALDGTRREALEPVRQAVKARFGAIGKDVAAAFGLRHDHGAQYMAHDCRNEIRWLGIASSPAFIRAPRLQGLRVQVVLTWTPSAMDEPSPDGSWPCLLWRSAERPAGRSWQWLRRAVHG